VSAHRERQVRLATAATAAVPAALEALGLPVDVCILACAALGDALAALGCGSARSVPVAFVVFNPPMVAALEAFARAQGRLPTERETRALLEAAPDRYTIGVAGGRAVRPSRWPGHLVLAWRGLLLLDPTLGQAARPQWGLDLGPVVAAPPPAALGRLARGTGSLPARCGGSLVVYQPLVVAPGTEPHTTSVHWRPGDPARRELARLVARAAQETPVTPTTHLEYDARVGVKQSTPEETAS
jgi:hypothetical protein